MDHADKIGRKLQRRMLTRGIRVQMELQTLHLGTAAAHTATSPGMQAGTVNMRND